MMLATGAALVVKSTQSGLDTSSWVATASKLAALRSMRTDACGVIDMECNARFIASRLALEVSSSVTTLTRRMPKSFT
jgi:hypothetical protein